MRHQKNRAFASMKRRLEGLEQERKEGSLSICFGGRKLFRAQFSLEENGYASFEEWKKDWEAAGSSEFFCLGSKDETSGNQSCVLTVEDECFHLRLRLPDSIAKIHGTKYLLLSGVVFHYGKKEVLRALSEKKALSCRFKRDEKGWRIFISFTQEKTPVLTKEAIGGIGIDVNADHLALTEIDPKGNPTYKKTFPLSTYGKTTDQIKALVGDACQKIVAFAKEKQKPLIAEKLDFTKKKATLKEGSSPKLAGMLSSLSYSHILESL